MYKLLCEKKKMIVLASQTFEFYCTTVCIYLKKFDHMYSSEYSWHEFTQNKNDEHIKSN